MKAAEISDKESFKAWLEAVPEDVRREVAVALASRCALRVLPLLRRGSNLSSVQHATWIRIMLWRFMFSRSLHVGPDRDSGAVEFATEAATFEKVDFADTAAAATFADANFHLDYAADAAAVAGAAAFAAVDRDTARAVDTAAHAAYAAALAADTFGADTWASVRDDATAVEQAGFVMGNGFQLFQDPLWKTQPNWFPAECDQFREMLHSADLAANGWGIWWQWYEPIIAGKPAFGLKDRKAVEALERAIALGSRDGTFNEAFWEREPRDINAEIAQWVAEARAAETLGEAAIAGPGLGWFATATQFQLVISGDASDADVAAMAETAFEHDKLKKRLAALSEKAEAISSRRGWEELKSVCDELTASIGVPTQELHTKILSIYDASLMLASLLDYNNKLLADRGGNEFRPLQADESMLLRQVVMTVAPWIGRFPTAKRKDEEAGQMFARMSAESIASHVEFVRLAQGAGLISDQDRQMMQSLLQALLKFGSAASVPAEKAQTHGQGTVRKLAFAMALLVGSMVVSVGDRLVGDVVSETQTYKSTKQFLLENVLEVEAIARELPLHLRSAFETIMDQLKRDNVQKSPPDPPVGDLPRRRRQLRRKL